MAAAGVAAEILSGAAGAIRNIIGELAAAISDELICAAALWWQQAAHDTAEGAVVTAAGGAAGDPSEVASAIRIFTGELRSDDSSDITTNGFW